MIRSAFSFCIIPLLLLISCNHVMYTPRSKKSKLREMPSMLLCERIVDFREEFGRWPVSRDDIANRGKKYYEVFRDFRYTYMHFKTKDSNTMVFTFSEHTQDISNYEDTRKIELNKYGGTVRFFKYDGKFIWKIKM